MTGRLIQRSQRKNEMTYEEAKKIVRDYTLDLILLEKPLKIIGGCGKILERMNSPNKYGELSDKVKEWSVDEKAELRLAGMVSPEKLSEAYSKLISVITTLDNEILKKHPRYLEALRIYIYNTQSDKTEGEDK
ncbi:MAG: hypothetical protein ABIJ14_00315 [Nanoarchaeota archaeon]